MYPSQPQRGPADSRRQTAVRNVGAILDAVERLLTSRRSVSIAAVAAEAGVSRVTVYAHFKDREGLLEAVVERSVRRTVEAVDAAEPEHGPAPDALARLLAAGWEEIARNDEAGHAAAAQLGPGAMRRAHEAARGRLRDLVERGRREGDFRADLPPAWLVTATLALIHAAADDVRGGDAERDSAFAALRRSVIDLLASR